VLNAKSVELGVLQIFIIYPIILQVYHSFIIKTAEKSIGRDKIRQSAKLWQTLPVLKMMNW